MRSKCVAAQSGKIRSTLFVQRLEDRRLLSAMVVTNLNDSGPGSLRQAILDANSNPGADSISFDPTLRGVIHLTGGQMQISDDLTINGPGRQQIYINANGSSRIFNIGSTANSTIQNLVIEGGQAPVGAGGGAILNQGTLAVVDDFITDCRAGTAINTTPNGSGGMGGAILSDSPTGLTVIGCMIANNSAGAGVATQFGAGSGGDGGGIASHGGLVVRDSTFIANVAGAGGNGTSSAGHPGSGGIGGNGGGVAAFNDALIVNSTFCYNLAGAGGPGTTSSVTFLSSSGGSGGDGGAIWANLAAPNTLTMVNDTIAGNSAGVGGPGGPGFPPNYPPGGNGSPGSGDGVASDSIASAPRASVGNSLITHNLGRRNQDAIGNFTSLGHDLIGDTAGSIGWVASDMTGIDLPLAPSDNGGSTRRDTCALMAGSAALDHGDNALLATYGITTDERGLPRIFNGTVDIGAYEAQPPAIAGDVTHDGKTDFSDLLELAQWYGKDVPLYEQGDLTGDGKVQFDDLLILAQNYGQGTTPAAAASASTSQASSVSTNLKRRFTARRQTKPEVVERTRSLAGR